MDTPQIYCSHTDIVATDSLIENPRNPNRHPEDQIIALAKIIRHQGWRNPIVVSRRSGFVVKGHGRLLAARMLGLEEVPVDYQDYENEAAEWADMVADNKIAELSNMDEEELNAIIRELDGQIDLELTGFNDSEINSMLASVSEDLEAVPDNVPLDADNDSTVTILPFIAYGAKGNRTQRQTGLGASRRLNHGTIVTVFSGGYGNGGHNTLLGCQKYKPFRLERMAAI